MIDRDAASYDAVLAAFKLPHGDSRETSARDATVHSAMKGEAEVPFDVDERTNDLLERVGQLNSIAAASMKSDFEAARWMAVAGARGAIANVETNLDGITDSRYVAQMRGKVSQLRERLERALHAPAA